MFVVVTLCISISFAGKGTAPLHLDKYDLTPDSPTATDNIAFTIRCSYDYSDQITGHVDIYRNDVLYSSASNAITKDVDTLLYTLSSANLVAGQKWRGDFWCETDQYVTPTLSDSVTIPQLPPPPPITPPTCTSSYITSSLVISLTQNRACGNDTVGVFISNISLCDGNKLSITNGTPTGLELCLEQTISNGQVFCYFQAPDELGSRNIYANVINKGSTYKTLNLVARPPFKQCFDAFGTPIPLGCDEWCTDKPIKRKWESVFSLSLPLHFTFGIFEEDSKTYSSLPDLANNTELHGFLSGTLKDCGSSLDSSYERNITRYKYEWNIQYDAIISAYSKTDYVPMFVGYNQTTILTDDPTVSSIVGPCEGDSLCYTEVPLCGDKVCDVNAGENCKTCASDCFAGSTAEFRGDCKIGCTSCSATDLEFADERRCVIKYSKETEDCNIGCSSQCQESGKSLLCTKNTIQGDILTPKGKCCPKDQVWNKITSQCELPREVILETVKLEFASKSFGDYYGGAAWCCPARPDAKWVKATYTLYNNGKVTETINLTSSFTYEKPVYGTFGVSLGQWAQEFFNDTIIIAAGTSKSISFHWSCIRTNFNECIQTSTVGIGEGGRFLFSPLVTHSAMLINFKVLTIPGSHFSQLDNADVICDTVNYMCSNSTITKGGIPLLANLWHPALCGGREYGGDGTIWAPTLPFPTPVDCDPFK